MTLDDIKRLFSNSYFTRAQVDILTRLADMLVAQGAGGGGSVSDITKADKTTLLNAGTGLSGGGDLSANRTFSLDLTFTDARYPAIVDGKIAAAVIPAQAIHDTFVVANQTAMLALSGAGVGDYAVRSDTGNTYVLSATPPSTLANWVLLPAPTGIASFNGRTGAVTPATGDYTFAQIGSKPTTLSGYGITDAEPTISVATTGDYWRGDKTFQPLNKVAVGLGNVDNTADNSKPLGTTQLGTLAAGTGATLIGSVPSESGGIARALNVVLYERLSLRSFANADGTDETSKVQAWLNALIAGNKRGYIPAGTYKVGDLAITTDYLDVECHPLAVFQGLTGGANPMLAITSSTGTSTARVGTVRWIGGKFDASIRAYSTEGTGAAMKVSNYAKVEIASVSALGAATHEAAITGAVAGSGIRLVACDRINASFNVFRGFAEVGLYITGGTSAVSISDDTIGGIVIGNHFTYCQVGAKATRAARNIVFNGNEYDTCYIGVAAHEADTAVRAARVTINGETFRRCGLNAINVRQQLGCVIGSNRIIDTGYKVDGTTAITSSAAILVQGCTGTKVHNNIVRMNDLTALSDSYGIRLASYTFNSITDAPTDCSVNDNAIQGVNYGVSEDGTGINNHYRNNEFSTVSTKYDGIPAAFAPYGSYIPTATPVSNVASATPSSAAWRRVEDDIIVDVYMSSVAASAAGIGEFTLDLPVDPGVDFVNDSDLIGVGSSHTENACANVRAKTGARTARVLATYAGTTAHSWGMRFSYRIGAVSTAPPPPPPPPGGNLLTTDAGVFITDESGNQITV